MKLKLHILFHFILFNIGYSQSGHLDNTFGTNGIVITDVSNNLLSDRINSLLVKGNGKIVAVGRANDMNGNWDHAIVQYNSNGTIDTTFGTNGIIILDINNQLDEAISLALQSDGKIITVGYSGNAATENRVIVVIRFNADGTLDNTFATNGIFTHDSGSNGDIGKSLVIEEDDNIYVGCQIGADFGIIKLSETGSIDTSFGANGFVNINFTVPFGGNNLNNIKIQADGKILIAGSSYKVENCQDLHYSDKTLIRLNPDGSLDTSFNNNGIIFNSFIQGSCGHDDLIYSIMIQSDGKIIVVGRTLNPWGDTNEPDVSMERYNVDGSLDTSFGTNGQVFTEFNGVVKDALLQNDGKIIVCGNTGNDFILLRYNNTGDLDSSFGSSTSISGATTTDLNNGSVDIGVKLAFQADNKILLAGNTRTSSSTNNFAIARYITDGNLDVEDFAGNLNNFLVYPNPFEDIIKIKNTNKNIVEVDVEIYNGSGKKIKKISNHYLNDDIVLNQLSKGIYFIKVSTEKKMKYFKLIKK